MASANSLRAPFKDCCPRKEGARSSCRPSSTFRPCRSCDRMRGASYDLIGVDCSLRRPMPPMMRRALPSTGRKLPANCRPLLRHSVAMPSFRTARPWQALKRFHRALRDLPRRDLPHYHEYFWRWAFVHPTAAPRRTSGLVFCREQILTQPTEGSVDAAHDSPAMSKYLKRSVKVPCVTYDQ
jgi:hypothetical protein